MWLFSLSNVRKFCPDYYIVCISNVNIFLRTVATRLEDIRVVGVWYNCIGRPVKNDQKFIFVMKYFNVIIRQTIRRIPFCRSRFAGKEISLPGFYRLLVISNESSWILADFVEFKRKKGTRNIFNFNKYLEIALFS